MIRIFWRGFSVGGMNIDVCKETNRVYHGYNIIMTNESFIARESFINQQINIQDDRINYFRSIYRTKERLNSLTRTVLSRAGTKAN